MDGCPKGTIVKNHLWRNIVGAKFPFFGAVQLYTIYASWDGSLIRLKINYNFGDKDFFSLTRRHNMSESFICCLDRPNRRHPHRNYSLVLIRWITYSSSSIWTFKPFSDNTIIQFWNYASFAFCLRKRFFSSKYFEEAKLKLFLWPLDGSKLFKQTIRL